MISRVLSTSLLCLSCVSLTGAKLDAGVFAEFVGSGTSRGAGLAFMPGDDSRVFVVEAWTGSLEVMDTATGAVSPTKFIQLTDLPASPAGEQGFLSAAFDPNYATNGYVYVNYTRADNAVVVKRFTAQGAPLTATQVDPNSGHDILIYPKSVNFHNGGWIEFGPDGHLYIGTGDGGNKSAAQSNNSVLGKLLRVDPYGDDYPEDPNKNFAIPATNPLVGQEGLGEVFASGLRNPYKSTFDRETGDLWIGDVGGAAREEVNFIPHGATTVYNFGWAIREGSIEGPPPTGGPAGPGLVEPVYDYPHIGQGDDSLYEGNSVTSGFVYRGSIEQLQGLYFFSDVASKNNWMLDPLAVDRRASVTNVNNLFQPNSGSLTRIVAYQQDSEGEIYMVDLQPPGEVFRLSTTSEEAVWNGDDSVGAAGDGQTWGDANNWSRGGAADTAFVTDDPVRFVAGTSQMTIDLGSDRSVASLKFEADVTLTSNTLNVQSGNITVEDGTTATIVSTLLAHSEHQSLRKYGGGTLLVEGDAGQTVVFDGVLGGSGTLDHLTVRGGTVAPGASLGVLEVDETITLSDDATIHIEIGGDDNSNIENPEYDQLIAGGQVTLAGTLEVVLFDNGSPYAPSLGEAYTVISSTLDMTGAFGNLNLSGLDSGLAWQVDTSDLTELVLNVVHELSGDYNLDGVVDSVDYAVWREMLGQTGAGLAADGTGPGGVPDEVVDQLDFDLWLANYGASTISPVSLPDSVPEPGAVMLLMLSAGALCASRHGRLAS